MPGLISLYRPYFDRSELLAVLRPGAGRSRFEAAIAEYVGARYALAFAYGRCGVVALLKALGIRHTQVIMPAYTCTVMADAVLYSDNHPVFVDIDPADYNMDIQLVKRALTPRTRAIIATHMYGNPADVCAIREQVGDERVLIIEDAALALRPSQLASQPMRSHIALYSFGRGKQLYTVSGGIIATNSQDLYEKMKAFRDREMARLPASVTARRRVQVATAYMALYPALERQLLRIKDVGAVKRTREATGFIQSGVPPDYDTAFADFQGQMGLAQLRKLDVVLERRRAIAELYHQGLQGIPGLTPAPMLPDATYTYYSVRVHAGAQREFRQLMWERGVEVGLNFNYTLPTLQAYQQYANGLYPHAEQFAREVANLPIYPGLKAVEIQRVLAATRDVMKECQA
jgi:dTDP-4-amino-4,6-dideoxygalactose transaminase